MLDYGLAGTGATVCARLLESLQTIYITNVWVGVDRAIVYTLIPNSGEDLYLQAGTTIRHTRNFPFGYDVEPDVPV